MKINEKIFKAYDIRGIYPDELNAETAYAIGLATANVLKSANAVVGRDMRLSSDELSTALISGLADGGADVTDIGLISTDGLYFAVGKYRFDCGVMITASHNPPRYNGMKICEREAVPLSGDGKLADVKRLIVDDRLTRSPRRGKITTKDILQDYVAHALGFVDTSKIKPFKVVVDAGNGMAGAIIPEVFKHLRCELVPLYFELDGSFPNHPASPIEPENVEDLKTKILETGADLGAAFDGDADRVFLIDENGKTLGGDMVTALVAKALLKKNPGSTIIYNLICSKSVPELVTKMGGRPIRTRVGHALIKPLMREHDAIFGGEHSGHFYFRDNWFADSGLIAFLVCLELISEAGTPLSEQVASFDHYVRSGEINSEVRRYTQQTPRDRIGLQRWPDRQARRPDDRFRRLVVQYQALEHRAAPPPQCRGREPGASQGSDRQGTGSDQAQVNYGEFDFSISILIADGDEACRRLLVETLSGLGYSIMQTSDIAEARECLSRHTADLVMTDIFMPGGDGLEFLFETKGKWPEIPVIMLSSHINEAGQEDLLDAGADGVLAKPFRISRVEELISTILLRYDRASLRSPRSRRKILIVDDDPGLLEFMVEAVRTLGYEAEFRTNAAEARKAFAAERFDLVVSDFMLPDSNGTDLIKSLKEMRPETPAVIVTGYPVAYPPSLARLDGIDGYLVKPFRINQLEQVMAGLLYPEKAKSV